MYKIAMCLINLKIFPQLRTLTGLTSVESLRICHLRHLCQLPQSDHANLCGMARDLYQQNPTKYLILKPPNNSNSFKKLDKTKKDDKKTALINDWIDIHEIASTFGTPELHDHLSGAIYSYALITEDKCSLTYRGYLTL